MQVLLRNFEEFGITYTPTIRGFSDSLLAARQLYTEAPSHRLGAMLTEVQGVAGWMASVGIVSTMLNLAGGTADAGGARCTGGNLFTVSHCAIC
jgi:hypothetical protein